MGLSLQIIVPSTNFIGIIELIGFHTVRSLFSFARIGARFLSMTSCGTAVPLKAGGSIFHVPITRSPEALVSKHVPPPYFPSEISSAITSATRSGVMQFSISYPNCFIFSGWSVQSGVATRLAGQQHDAKSSTHIPRSNGHNLYSF
jgi:hypothetical protein